MSAAGAGLHSPPGAFLQCLALTLLDPLNKRLSVPTHRDSSVIQRTEKGSAVKSGVCSLSFQVDLKQKA